MLQLSPSLHLSQSVCLLSLTYMYTPSLTHSHKITKHTLNIVQCVFPPSLTYTVVTYTVTHTHTIMIVHVLRGASHIHSLAHSQTDRRMYLYTHKWARTITLPGITATGVPPQAGFSQRAGDRRFSSSRHLDGAGYKFSVLLINYST